MKEKFAIFFNRQIYRMVHFDLHDYRKSIFIAGSARSGTTWLQEIVNYKNDYRILFEPFDPSKVDLLREWKDFQYLRANENDPKFLDPMKDILTGHVKDAWVNSYNKRLFSNRRIIKAIYANLLLFWMKNHFSEVPILLILRHPCAVANSRINIVGKNFRYDINPLNSFLTQNELVEDFLQPYEEQIRGEKTVFETFIFMWCIENLVPLTQFQKGEIYVTFYENLCVTPENEIKKIFSYINKPYSSDVMKKVNTPGVMSREKSAINQGTNLIRSWRKNITDDQIQRAVEILNLFGLDMIYNGNDMPLIDSKELLSKF